VALFVSWMSAAGWGLYYLVAVASMSPAFVADAVAHFVAGYVWGRAVMTPSLSVLLAMFGTLLAGAYTRLALGMGTSEMYFAWAGPLAAIALSDTTSSRNIASSVVAFALGYLALIWLAP
jgi:hypothetical protein